MDDFLFPNPPVTIDKDVLDQLLLHSVNHGASDVHIQTDSPVIADIFGRMRTIINRPTSQNEVRRLVDTVFGEHAVPVLSGGNPYDDAYNVRKNRSEYVRFRVNATACLVNGQNGIQITLRTIPTTPPHLDDMELPKELCEALSPEQGLVCVTGATGSGKSTLLASNIRALCENPDSNHKILTIESPIEYVFDSIDKPSTLISQSQVGKHLPSFAGGVEAALRRKPTILLVGESRDPQTIEASILASQTGHLVYTTVHTNGVAETVRRMVGVFPGEQRAQIQADLIDALRVIITQKLVRSVDGKRVALREYLVFTSEMRNQLLDIHDSNKVVSEIRKMVANYGQPMIVDAQKKYTEGRISEHEFKQIRESFSVATVSKK